MGNYLSLCLGPSDVTADPDDWKNWDAHPAARRYVVGKQIGSGGFSEVYLAKRKPILFDGEEVALKVIFLGNPKLADAAKELLRAESSILQRLHHPHVVDVRRTFMWPAKQILIIEEEMLHGEELLTAADEAISDYGFQMTESFAVRVMRQVLLALEYLHSRRVLHRDIKAENLRLTRPTKDWVADIARFKVKLIDFGLSCMLDDRPEVGWLGTAGYVAPEVIERKPHTPAMDIFSAGVVLFILLTGMKPMENEAALELSYSKLEAHEYPNMVGNARWDAVSAGAQSLVLGLLQRDPRQRPSARQALEHPFLKKGGRSRDVAAAVAADTYKAADAPESAAAVAAALQRQASAVKETDRLQVDGGTVKNTLQTERWRELFTIICQMRAAVAGGSPTSGSSHETIPTDVVALWQKALRRGYVRAQRNTFHFSAGRVTAAPAPRPALPRSLSLSTLQSGATASLAGDSPPRGPPPRSNSLIPVLAGGSSGSSERVSVRGAGGGAAASTPHQRAMVHELLEQMLEDHALADEGNAHDLQRLEREGTA